ncbi:MAG: enoyl-CoA hydratase/isomerase family protein [Halolamina sp.]
MVTEYEDGVVLLERDDGIARVRLNAPESRNALSDAVTAGLIEALREVEGSDARCVVIEAEGPAFCAGGDIDAMVERHERDATAPEAVERVIQQVGRSIQRVVECPLPTVAKVDGAAFGAGANLAIACDVQLLSDDAKLGFGFRQVGLAVDSGTSYLLPRLVGDNVAKELVFTGELLSAERAVELGLANHVYPEDSFQADAEAFIERVASGPTVALRTSKRLLRYGRDASLSEAVAHEAVAQGTVFDSSDHAEGIAAFRESREPEFDGE